MPRHAQPAWSGLPVPALNELEAEPSLHAQVTVTDVMVERGGYLDDPVVLDVQFEVAPDSAVGADGGGDGLPGLVPAAVLPHVVLAGEHQGAGRAYPDAVTAVDTGRIGQADVELGGDAGIKPPAGDRDRERVLGVLTAGLDALVAQDAARVVADIAVVVALHRLGDRLGHGARGRLVLAGTGRVPLPGSVWRGRRAITSRVRAITLHPAAHLRRGKRHVGGRGQELQDHPPARAHPLG